jgi:N-acetylmuramoyl-L-alanine amidase
LNARPLPLFSALATLAFAAGLTAVLISQTSAPSLSLLTREGRRSVPLTLANDQELVALDDLASTFQLFVQESLGAITVSYKGKTIVLTPDQTLASVAGRMISLPGPPSRAGRRWLVPVEFISRALAPIYDVRIELRKPSRLLIVGDLRVPRLNLRYDSLGAAGRLTIDATPRANSTVSQENEHVTIKFEADAIDVPTPLISALPPGALVQAVRVVDPLTLAVDLVPRFGGLKSTSQPVDNTTRLILDLAPPPQTETPAQPAAPNAPPPPPELPPAFGQPVSTIRTVAIDPGHGGEDEGAKGANGAKEKDLALAIARRLKGTIEARLGIRVLLTRDDDRNVPIDERTAVANNNKADLFVSLHANASMRKTTAGAAIFYAAFDKADAESTGGGHERIPAFGGGLRDIEMVPWDLAQIRHLDRSSAFADLLYQQLKDRVPMASRPTDQAPLRVLESANMPAVLIELGYLSNPDQEKLIAGDAFQGTFVQGFYDALIRFRDALSNGGGR